MNLIGLLGIFALLGLAWVMSYHRRSVKFSIVAWGIGLQVLFAVIILRDDAWSFAGMTVFGMLILVYLLQTDHFRLGRGWPATAALAAVGLGIGAVFTWLIPAVVPYLLAIVVVAMMINGGFRLVQPAQRYLAALVVILGVAFLISRGLHGQLIFDGLSQKVSAFLGLSDYGAKFLFGNLSDPQYYFPGADSGWPGFGFQFAFKVLPTILFFGGFMGVLYYLGIMQRVIEAMARFMRWTIGTSGAETLSCTANIFVGQTEAPLLIKPFLDDMTRSELLTIMVGGFATIAGGFWRAISQWGCRRATSLPPASCRLRRPS